MANQIIIVRPSILGANSFKSGGKKSLKRELKVPKYRVTVVKSGTNL